MALPYKKLGEQPPTYPQEMQRVLSPPAISVQQTRRGCCQECFGCEAKSEYKPSASPSPLTAHHSPLTLTLTLTLTLRSTPVTSRRGRRATSRSRSWATCSRSRPASSGAAAAPAVPSRCRSPRGPRGRARRCSSSERGGTCRSAACSRRARETPSSARAAAASPRSRRTRPTAPSSAPPRTCATRPLALRPPSPNPSPNPNPNPNPNPTPNPNQVRREALRSQVHREGPPRRGQVPDPPRDVLPCVETKACMAGQRRPQAAAWPRLAGGWGSLRHDLAPKSQLVEGCASLVFDATGAASNAAS
eukprot:scaffold21602_cov52-Phaeocystis_antarctica.AAC.1